MPHLELNALSMPPGAAEWTVFVLMALAGLCFVGLAVVYGRGARRVAEPRPGQHRTGGQVAAAAGGSPTVCAVLGVALLVVAASILTGFV